MRTLVALVVSVLVTACGQVAGTDPGASDPDPLAGAWVLRAGTTATGPLPLAEDDRVTLEVDGESVHGVSGCNHYSGDLARTSTGIAISGLGGTEMGCPPRLMELERLYLDALHQVQEAVVDADRLVLTGTAGARLELDRVQPVEEAPLAGTRWRLETLVDRDVAGSTSGAGTLRLDEDGSLAGSAGCLPFGGHYRLDGDRLVTDDVHTPGGMTDCELQAQHDHVLAVLAGGPRVSVQGDRLTLTGANGLGVVYRAAR